jgi:hypothetical protein
MTKHALSLLLAACSVLSAQTVNTSQQVTLQGLRTSANHGSFTAAAYAADGSLILLYNQHDGIRLLKTNAAATTLLAQSQQGATGDSGLAVALDPSGNIYVTGTTTSNRITGTSGTAYPSRYDTTTNSFVAKYDANLNPLWLTFLGAGATSAASIAATANGAIVTGLTYSQVFPVTPSAIQQTPSPNYNQNGFVESFTTTGAVTYATYLNGFNGSTTPTSIATDNNGNAYITGSTNASDFPTINALIPNILNNTSGFLAALNPTGSAFLYSTFLPGNGLNSIALDASTQSLLLTGNIALGQFPIDTVTTPLVSIEYQSLLRLPLDGQSITSATLLVPGTQSFVTPGPNTTAWITGALTTPLFPGDTAPDYASGDSFLLHLTATNTIDQTLRFGGLPISNALYSSLTTTTAAPAVNNTAIALTGTLTATTASSLLNTQRFDIPFVQAPNAILSNSITDMLPATATCPNSSQCSGTAALLALIDTSTSAPILSLSANNLPNITLRNLGSAIATNLNITASGYTLTSNCTTTLAPSNVCTIALTGTGPGSITASALNATTNTLPLPTNTLTANPIVLSTNELDFGIATSTSPAITRTLTLTNLTATPQIFTSAIEPGSSSPFTETATTCGSLTAHTIAANSACTITLALAASTTADAAESAYWLVAKRDIKLTGFSQVASLNLSSTEIDFGTQFSGATSLLLPRYLYISNNAATPITHNLVALPTTSPFSVTDNCPNTLEPHSVCGLKLIYNSPTTPSDDSVTLALDNNLSVLVTGQTLAPSIATGSATNPSLSVSTTAVSFATPVTVTGISGTQQSITVTNSGAIPFALTAAITGDFQLTNTCPATLNANASCQIFLNFAPSQPGKREGLISLTAGSNFAPTLIAVTGTASAIFPTNNGVLSLGETYVDEPAQIFIPIQQSLPSLTAATNSPLFNIALIPNTGNAPITLPPSSFTPTATASCTSCYLGIQFLSQNPGAQSATLTLSTIANGNPYQLTLAGNALPVQGLLLTPTAQDFGLIPVNSTSPALTFALANLLPSPSAITITSVAATGDFAITNNNTGGASCSGTLAPTDTCYMQLLFAPTAEGNRTGTLTITTSGGTITAALTGYGALDPGLSLSPNALNFNLAPNTTAGTQTVTLKNTGTTTLTIATPTTTTTNFSNTTNCTTLTPSQTCTITVNFTATTTNITDTLSIPLTTSENGQSTTSSTVPLIGNYTTQDSGLQILPAQVNLGATTTGTLGNTREFTLNNLTAKQLAVTLTMPHQFPLADNTACTTLAANASCTFTVSFLPATSGALTGTVFAQGTPTDNSAPAQSLAYMQGYGAGVAALTITGFPIPNNPVTFSTLTSGQTAQETLTLINSGSTPLNIHRITSNPPFLSTTNCATSLTTNASCTVTITYAPIYELPTGSTNLTLRNDIGQLLIESDAATSPNTVALSGSVASVLSSSPASAASLATYSLTQQSLTFANTAVGNSSTTQTVTLINTGTTILHIASAIASTDFTATTTCATLAPGNICTIGVQFTPTTASTNTVRSGSLEISSDATTSLEFLSLLGISSAAPLTLSPTALDFGTLNVASSTTLSVNVTNTTAMPITFLNLSATGDYATTQNTCPANGSTLAANATCILNITFTPTITGTRTGTLSLTTDATILSLTASLTGIAVSGILQITPSAIAFGNISIASPAPHILTIQNIGNATITNIATNITGTNAADFAVTSPCANTRLEPTESCTATITFMPSAPGARAATLSITSTDPNSPALIPLTGTGIAANNGSFTLTVNGTATSQSITVTSGTPATYALTLTPLNNFTGNVALTCAPTSSAQYASCSLLSPTQTLAELPQVSTVTINTITTSAHTTTLNKILALLFTPIVFLASRRRRQRLIATVFIALTCIGFVSLSGCGSSGGHGSGSNSTNILYTPAGVYQYQVTATSTSGPTIASTVTLNLVVQ